VVDDTARLALRDGRFERGEDEPPPVYKGQYDPRVLVHALETMHRR
jgi:hypothetical protein